MDAQQLPCNTPFLPSLFALTLSFPCTQLARRWSASDVSRSSYMFPCTAAFSSASGVLGNGKRPGELVHKHARSLSDECCIISCLTGTMWGFLKSHLIFERIMNRTFHHIYPSSNTQFLCVWSSFAYRIRSSYKLLSRLTQVWSKLTRVLYICGERIAVSGRRCT